MSSTLARSDLDERSFNSNSFIRLFNMIVFRVIFLPGRPIRRIQGNHCRNTVLICNNLFGTLFYMSSISTSGDCKTRMGFAWELWREAGSRALAIRNVIKPLVFKTSCRLLRHCYRPVRQCGQQWRGGWGDGSLIIRISSSIAVVEEA